MGPIFLLFSVVSRADDAPARWHVDVEGDPVTFLSRGYAVVVGVKPKPLPSWRFGLGAFSAELPDAISINPENEGFHVDIERAFALTVHTWPLQGRGGPYVGGALVTVHERFTHDEAPGRADEVDRYALSGHLGYQWLPFRKIGLYVQPFVHVSLVGGPDVPTVGDLEFRETPLALPYAKPVSGSMLVHLGWEL